MKYTAQQRELLFDLEIAIDRNLEIIDRTFQTARESLSWPIQHKIFKDWQKAFKENNEVLEIINQNASKVTELHTKPCLNSGITECICGDSMGLSQRRREEILL